MSVQAISWVLDYSQSSGTVRCVLISIANHVNPDGTGWVYVERILKEANCSLKSYHRAVQWALDNGELERSAHEGGFETTHSRHRPNLFRFPKVASEVDKMAAAAGWGSQDDDEGDGQIDYPPPSQSDYLNKRAVNKAVSKAKRNIALMDDEKKILDAWCDATGRKRGSVRMTPDRQRKILARLREGYTMEDLLDAVRGVALSPFHMGKNTQRQKYDDLVIVLRDGSQVEKFRDLYRSGPARSEPQSFDAIKAAVDKIERGE